MKVKIVTSRYWYREGQVFEVVGLYKHRYSRRSKKYLKSINQKPTRSITDYKVIRDNDFMRISVHDCLVIDNSPYKVSWKHEIRDIVFGYYAKRIIGILLTVVLAAFFFLVYK